MSNTLIDLEGLRVFYTKILTEDLAEYARYDGLNSSDDNLNSSAIIAPTLVGGSFKITITNNDPRTLTFYWLPAGDSGTLSSSYAEGSTVIGGNGSSTVAVAYGSTYQIKAYTEDGIESDIYTVEVDSSGGGGYN